MVRKLIRNPLVPSVEFERGQTLALKRQQQRQSVKAKGQQISINGQIKELLKEKFQSVADVPVFNPVKNQQNVATKVTWYGTVIDKEDIKLWSEAAGVLNIKINIVCKKGDKIEVLVLDQEDLSRLQEIVDDSKRAEALRLQKEKERIQRKKDMIGIELPSSFSTCSVETFKVMLHKFYKLNKQKIDQMIGSKESNLLDGFCNFLRRSGWKINPRYFLDERDYDVRITPLDILLTLKHISEEKECRTKKIEIKKPKRIELTRKIEKCSLNQCEHNNNGICSKHSVNPVQEEDIIIECRRFRDKFKFRNISDAFVIFSDPRD